jgi:mono/diheme cytochrome c family protein
LNSLTASWSASLPPTDIRERFAAFLTLLDPNPPGLKGQERWHFDQHAERGSKDSMQLALERTSLRKLWFRRLTLGAISVLIGSAAHAQNLDQGKSAVKLFADSCATCHRSARGLAKGRFRLTLFLFLQEHYASNSSSAWALTSYLESVDSAQHDRSRDAAAKSSPPTARSSRPMIRPPAPVPGH